MGKLLSYYFELAARWHVFLLLSAYGIGKLLGGQFYRRGDLPAEIAQLPLAEVGGFDLAWSFMGYSYVYILFIGVSQIIGAFLLLFNKTKLIGVAILIPILVNIIVFDAVFLDTYGALASASIYFLLLLYILYYNKGKIIKVLKALMSVGFLDNVGSKGVKTVVIVIMLMGIVFGIEQFFVNLLGH